MTVSRQQTGIARRGIAQRPELRQDINVIYQTTVSEP
jgi:hypothetical protein